MNRSLLCELIKSCLWNLQIDRKKFEDLTIDEYEVLKKHGLLMLPMHVYSSLSLDAELRSKLEKDTLSQLTYYCRYIYIQNHLPLTVPYVILKGTTAAQYYPFPECRLMGDIDIMPSRENYNTSCNELLADGYQEVTIPAELERGRHRSFFKGGILIEVHSFFASINDPTKAEIFDDLIVNNINPTHVLPDMINGMVLIEHVGQHMEEGIGLRQIIDWMMFVDKCLPNDKWPSFQKMAKQTDLETLAIVVTRMCEIYLGLPEHNWCKDADERLCSDLMNYVIDYGRFDLNSNQDNKVFVNRLLNIRNISHMIGELQGQGTENWKAAKNPLLKPFSWIWQGMQYLKESNGVIDGTREAVKLNKMLNSLGVKRKSRGLIYYENGKYIMK